MGRFSEDIIRLFELFKKETGKYKDLDLKKLEFEEKKLEEVAKFPRITRLQGGIDLTVEEYEKLNEKEKKDYYPLLTGTVENNQIGGFVHKSRVTERHLSESNVISWSRINASFFFIQKEKVCINDDAFIMDVKRDYYINYIQIATMATMQNKEFGWTNKAGKEKVKQVKIPIPKPFKNYTSYDIQKAIADFIEFVTLKSEEVQKLMDEIISKTELLRKTLLVKLFTKLPYEKRNGKRNLKDIIRLFELFKKETGKYKDLDLKKLEFEEKKLEEVAKFPRITRLQGGIDLTVEEYEKLNEKEKKDYYPLLTGTVENNQIGGFVHKSRVTERHLSESNVISWSRINASFFFIQKEKVCINDDAFIMDVKRDYYINYIQIATMATMQNKEFGWTNKAGKEKVKQVKIPIPKPLGDYNSYDIQKAIADFVEFINRKLDFCKEFAEEYKSKSIKLNKLLLRKIFG